MPWKNGQGFTSEIAISPAGASFPEGEFSWRLSSALVGSSGAFSQFPGCDRWLVVLEGQGLSLNGRTLGPFTPLHFHGEEVVQAELLQNAVMDLGFIYSRQKVSAQMDVVQVPRAGAHCLSATTSAAFVFCVSGSVLCGEEALSPSECFFLENAEVNLSCEDRGALMVLIQIQSINET